MIPANPANTDHSTTLYGASTYLAGLPSVTGPQRKFAALKKRTSPKPWDAAALERYFRGCIPFMGPKPPSTRPRTGMTARLRMIPVGEERLMEGAGNNAHSGSVWGCAKHLRAEGMDFTTRAEAGVGVWVTRLQ